MLCKTNDWFLQEMQGWAKMSLMGSKSPLVKFSCFGVYPIKLSLEQMSHWCYGHPLWFPPSNPNVVIINLQEILTISTRPT